MPNQLEAPFLSAGVANKPLDTRSWASRNYRWLCLICLLGLALLLVIHVGIGRVAFTPGEVIAALFDRPADLTHRQIVWELRLPRALVAVLAGAMLALAGGLLQVLTSNPLAEPGLTGVSGGAVLGSISWLSFSGPQSSTLPLALVALLGGLGSAFLVYLLSYRRRSDPFRLALTGVIVSSIFSAATSLVVTLSPTTLGSALQWLIGSLNGVVWIQWQLIWPWALFTLPLGLGCAGVANTLQLGDEVALSLGLRVNLARLGLLGVAVFLTAGAVTVVGAVSFVGLIGPHIARRLVGEDARRLFPLSALTGAILLLGADVASRWLTQPVELPVGAVMALLGAPFFFYLIRSNMRPK